FPFSTPSTTAFSTLSLHDALPIFHVGVGHDDDAVVAQLRQVEFFAPDAASQRRDHRPDLVAAQHLVEPRLLHVQNLAFDGQDRLDRKSTRLNSSHVAISYAVFCLK